jgi:hypothetical protein
MAENTTNPRRRTPAKSAATTTKTAAKTAPATAETPEKDTAPTTSADGRTAVELHYTGDTTRHAKFSVPEEWKAHGVAGSIYAPPGTTRVGVVFFTDSE